MKNVYRGLTEVFITSPFCDYVYEGQVTESIIFKNLEINIFCAKLRVKNVFVFSSFYCNMICFTAMFYILNNSRSHMRSAQLLSDENVSSMSLPGWL